MIEETYTYTARSAQDSSQVITFTLHNQSMSVELGAPLEHIERAFRTPEGEEEGENQAIAWLKPLAISLLERGTHPFNVADVEANAEDNGLRVIAWGRSGGLRLAPIILTMTEVDNPEAAQAFAREVNKRKEAAAHPGKLPGLLDYWASWFVAGMLAFIFVTIWLKKRNKAK